jgi:hypothetical protein
MEVKLSSSEQQINQSESLVLSNTMGKESLALKYHGGMIFVDHAFVLFCFVLFCFVLMNPPTLERECHGKCVTSIIKIGISTETVVRSCRS